MFFTTKFTKNTKKNYSLIPTFVFFVNFVVIFSCNSNRFKKRNL